MVATGEPAKAELLWAGKKKMRSLGTVQIPTDTRPQAGVQAANRCSAAALRPSQAFLAVLKLDE